MIGRRITEARERREAERAEQQAANLRNLATVPAHRLHTGTYSGDIGKAISKECPARSEAYRRLVAAMPCANCGAAGPNQAAHANFGKGMGIKSSDTTCFPLCVACHQDHDQGGMLPRDVRRANESRWGAMTRAAIIAAGAWPANLPLWENA